MNIKRVIKAVGNIPHRSKLLVEGDSNANLTGPERLEIDEKNVNLSSSGP